MTASAGISSMHMMTRRPIRFTVKGPDATHPPAGGGPGHEHVVIGRAHRRNRGQHEAGDAAGDERRDRDRGDVRPSDALTLQHALPQVAVEGPANGSQGTFWFPGLFLYEGG
jgi:hypothetical protein